MSYSNLKPGTRGLLRSFKTIKGDIGPKYKTVKGKKYRSINAIQKRHKLAQGLKIIKTPLRRKDIVIKMAASLRKHLNLTGTP